MIDENQKEEFQLPSIKREALQEAHQEHLVKVNHQNPEPPVRGEKLLRAIDLWFLRITRSLEKWVPEDLNPLAQTGAIANMSFFLAILTGVLILLWYDTSVHTAYSSLEFMKSFWLAQLVRSLHRYSADVCMFFVLIHAFEYFVARRFTGPRWLAWFTGGILLFFLWLDGWTGYWLVWDERAKLIAKETAKMLDVLPLFAEPISRSFLASGTINSLLFFLVFFLHMLIPMGMGLALWLHIARLNQPKFLTSKRMTLALFIAFIGLSLLFPAYSDGPAQLDQLEFSYTMDLLYTVPLYLSQVISHGMAWLVLFAGSIVFITVPWWMATRHRDAAYVLEGRCNGCQQCFEDCPYNAIDMISTPEGKWDQLARINPEKCVSCGICVGACPPGAIIFPRLPVQDARKRIEEFIDQATHEEENAVLAFLCANSAASDLEVDINTGKSPQLPGYRVLPLPCSGWVSPFLLERALKKGAKGILVVGCGPEPMYRTGTLWTELRLEGKRIPVERKAGINKALVRFMRYDRSSRDEFLKNAHLFRKEIEEGEKMDKKALSEEGTHLSKRQAGKKLLLTPSTLWATIILLIFFLAAYGLAHVPAQKTSPYPAALVVSFQHPGQFEKIRFSPTPKKKKKNQLSHMQPRGMVVGAERRKRVPVRMEIYVDGKRILSKSYPPSGLFGDGASVALEVVPINPGAHRVEIRLGDTADPKEWSFTWKKEIIVNKHKQKVIFFDKIKGFRVY